MLSELADIRLRICDLLCDIYRLRRTETPDATKDELDELRIIMKMREDVSRFADGCEWKRITKEVSNATAHRTKNVRPRRKRKNGTANI